MFSQHVSYGVLFGANYHDTKIKGDSGNIDEWISDKPNIHLGAFVEYQFTNRFGVKLNTQYNKSHEKYQINYIPQTETVEHRIHSLELVPHLKFDVETDYNKGLYFLAGPRISIVLSAEDQDGDNVKDFYKSKNFGAEVGFGINIARTFAIEIIGDYGFSDVSKSEPITIRAAGAYLNLNIDIESLINK